MKSAVRNSEPARETFDGGRLALCLGPQPMIDGDGKEFGRALAALFESLGPTRGDEQERSRIGAAGNREKQPM
jgi:hypothetical protein